MVAAIVCFSTVSHIHPLPIWETLQDQQVGLSQTFIRLLLFSLGPVMCEIWGVPFKSEVSVSPSPVKALRSNPTSLQSQIPWRFLVALADPQTGKPDMGLRTFTTVGELIWYCYSPVCGSPTWQVWDLILL